LLFSRQIFGKFDGLSTILYLNLLNFFTNFPEAAKHENWFEFGFIHHRIAAKGPKMGFLAVFV